MLYALFFGNVLGACELVVRGCSIQIGSLGADNSPHFNGNTKSKGERGLLKTGTGAFKDRSEFQYLGVKEVLSGSIVPGEFQMSKSEEDTQYYFL